MLRTGELPVEAGNALLGGRQDSSHLLCQGTERIQSVRRGMEGDGLLFTDNTLLCIGKQLPFPFQCPCLLVIPAVRLLEGCFCGFQLSFCLLSVGL